MALDTQPSPHGDRLMPTKSRIAAVQHHEVPIVDRSTGRVLKRSASASRSVTITAASPSTHEWSPYGSLGCEYGGRDDPLQHTQPPYKNKDPFGQDY